VGVGQGVGHGRRDPGRLRPGRAVLPQPLAEVRAVEEVRDDVDLSPLQADVVDRHDAGVGEPCESACLLEESLGLGVRHVGAAVEDLDRHRPIELRVVAEVYRAEAARSQGAPHRVAAEGGRRVLLRRRCVRRTRREVRGQIRLAPRPRSADRWAGKRRIRLHGDIARGLVWVELTRWVQCRFLPRLRGSSLRRSRGSRAEHLGGMQRLETPCTGSAAPEFLTNPILAASTAPRESGPTHRSPLNLEGLPSTAGGADSEQG
jgi:hypothetical protein